MSVVLNGNTYSISDFTGTDGRGYSDIFAATGTQVFPESIFTDLLLELAATAPLSIAYGAAGGIIVSTGSAWARAVSATITSAGAAAFATLAVTGVSTLGSRIDHKTGGTGGTLCAQYGSGNDIGLNTSGGTTDFNVKCVGEFAVSAGASATTNFLIAGTDASFAGTLAVTSTITTATDLIIGTNPSSSGDIRFHKNFGILARNQENDGDMYVLTSGHITGNVGSEPALASLEIGSNTASTWAAIRFHAGAANCMVITPTSVTISKDLEIPTATFGQNLPTSSGGLASGRMWVDSGTVKVIA